MTQMRFREMFTIVHIIFPGVHPKICGATIVKQNQKQFEIVIVDLLQISEMWWDLMQQWKGKGQLDHMTKYALQRSAEERKVGLHEDIWAEQNFSKMYCYFTWGAVAKDGKFTGWYGAGWNNWVRILASRKRKIGIALAHNATVLFKNKSQYVAFRL